MNLKISENYNLKENNTFGFDVKCKKFIEIEYLNYSQLNTYKNLLLNKNFLVLGNGSNILFNGDFNGNILHLKNEDRYSVSSDEKNYNVLAWAGMNFDNLIKNIIEKHNVFGLENLSSIPGTVGAAIVQNIGAYGSEISNFVTKVRYFNIEIHEIKTLTFDDLKLEYRNSIFKEELKNKAIVLEVFFTIPKDYNPNLNYNELKNIIIKTQEYQEYQDYISKIEKEKLDIDKKLALKIRETIKIIREAKIPDYKIFGNAGSFFKNPIVSIEKYIDLKNQFPELKCFLTAKSLNGKHENLNIYNKIDLENYERTQGVKIECKIAAGWLIEKSGMKGFEHNGAAVYENNALILINKYNCLPKNIVELSKIIKEKINNIFGIFLEEEVIII